MIPRLARAHYEGVPRASACFSDAQVAIEPL
jgi:hypothetical protein